MLNNIMEIIPEAINSTLDQESNEGQVSDKVPKECIEKSSTKNVNVCLEQKKDIETGNDVSDAHVDAFTDENNEMYIKYQLRKPVNNISRITNEEDMDQSSTYILPEKKKKLIKETVYKCSVCSLIVDNQYVLTVHMRKHISKNKFTCSRCQETFDTNKELLEHKKTHSDEENCYMCTKCAKAFSSELTFLQHGFNHIKKGPFKCPECLVTSTSRRSIQYHCSNHFDIREACRICKTLVLKRNMSTHVNSHTTVKCVECGKICSNKAHYQYHLTSHTGVKLHQCLYCGRGFSNGAQKVNHMKLHTGEKSFECKICFQVYTQASTRDKHERTHSTEKKFECDICHKKFKIKVSIKGHLRLHYNYRPYQCPSCPLKFTTPTHLTSHTYTSHMEKMFKCDLCNLKFSLKKDLGRHLTSKKHQQNVYRLKREQKNAR